MNGDPPRGKPKVHPASREILPADPLEMRGFEVTGDPRLMLQLLVEEYARIGWDAESILRLARDRNYRAFHGLWKYFGEEELRRRVLQTISRCGVMRVTQQEKSAARVPDELVQIDLPH